MLDRAGGTKRLTKPREGAAPDKQAGERILELLQGDVDESKSEYQELPGLFELFLAPLQPDVGHKEASLSLSKKFASFLVQAVKLSFEQLGKATKTTCRRKVEILASCACQAIDGLYTARQAVKGRPLEMELQTYGLVRRLVAVGLYNRAAKYGKILYLQLCSLYVDGRSASAVVSPSWPPAPSPAEKHDPEAPRLLVCCVLNALMCASAANGLDDAEPLDNLSPALHSIPPWLSLVEVQDKGQFRDSILHHAVKAVAKLQARQNLSTCPGGRIRDFLAAALSFCCASSGLQGLQKVAASLTSHLPLNDILFVISTCLEMKRQLPADLQPHADVEAFVDLVVAVCEKEGCWDEGSAIFVQSQDLQALPHVGYYHAAFFIQHLQSRGTMLSSHVCHGAGKNTVPLSSGCGDWLSSLQAANAHVKSLIGGEHASRKLRGVFMAMNTLRRSITDPESFIATLEAHNIDGVASAVEAFALALDLFAVVVSEGAPEESQEMVESLGEPCLSTPHAWSCAASAAVQGAKLRCAMRQLLHTEVASLCSVEAWGRLWRDSPNPGRGVRCEELQWLAATMHNLSLPLAKEGCFALAYAPLEVSYRASMKLATLQTPAVADVNAVARKCVALSKCMLQSGAVETGLDLLADELSCFILLEWDASPISEELVRAWRKTGSNGLWTWIQSRLSSSVAQTPVLRLVVKALQQEVIQSAGAENLVKELELAVGALVSDEDAAVAARTSAAVSSHLSIMLSSIDASHGTGLWHELVDSMRMLEAECSSSSTSAACSAKACYSFVCCVYGFCGVESALPERDALAADSQKPFWDSIHQGIALLDKLLCESPDTLAQGWAPGSSLGEQHELGMLLELASLCSIHGRCTLHDQCLAVCKKLAALLFAKGSTPVANSISAVLAIMPSLCCMGPGVVSFSDAHDAFPVSGGKSSENIAAVQGIMLRIQPGKGARVHTDLDDLRVAESRLKDDCMLPARTSIGIRAWINLFVAEIAYCSGRVQEGLKAAQEAMRLSSALLHGLGLRVSTADRQKGSSTAVRPLDAISSGMGHWQALFLQLCSLLLVGQHCDAAGSWTEAEGALRFGMQQAQRLAADSIVVVFAATLADVQRKRHCWEACEQSLKFGTLANAAAETCCCQCSSYRSALLARVSGDCLRKRGCEAQALQCYSSALVHFPILKLSKKGMFPAVECIRARMGIAKCSAVLDDHGHAKEALARAADDLGFDMRNARSCYEHTSHAITEAAIAWQMAFRPWNSSLVERGQQDGPVLWTPLSVSPKGRSTRGVARSRARKRPEDSDVDVLSLLLLAYALGRELPLLRRRVALAIATMTGPFASTLFLHCSMGVTVEQQFVSILGDRAEQNLSNGSADRAAQLHAIQALLVAPVLPEHLLFQEGRITLKTKGKIAAASNGRQDLILQDIETWAHDRLALYAHHLRDKAVVCALAALPGEARQSILLSRWAPNCTPILIQLPVEPSNQQGACDTADVGKQGDVGIVAQLAEMLQASTRGLRSCRPVETAAQKKQWWKERVELDQGVRELLTRMEGHWLGGMGFLLMGPSQSCHQSFHILDKLCSEQGVGDQLLLKGVVMALMDASCNMTQEEVDSACDAIASLSDVPASRNFHAVVDGIRSCLGAKDFVKSGTGPISSSREIRRALSTGEDHINTKPDGRETSQGTIQGNVDSGAMRASRRSGRLSRMATACNEEGLAEARSSSTSSRAPKLSEHEPARQTRRRNPQTSRGAGLADGFDATAGIADAGQEERNSDVADCASVILVLDSWLQALPWESLSMLQRSTIYRSPSLSCAVALQSLQGISDEDSLKCRSIDPLSTFYLLNPGRDLSSTQAEFEGWFLQQPSWEGCVGDTLPPDKLVDRVCSHDLYIYFGHGAGEKYLSSQALKTAYMNSAALLMGCSSGRLRDCGDYEATGVVLSYFTAGCPAAVTNLWDVTDRDIDRFSRCLLEKWIGAPGQDDENRRSSCAREGPHSAQLSETVSFGRKSCRLPYLTGAAPVCYGIPTQVKLQLVSGI